MIKKLLLSLIIIPFIGMSIAKSQCVPDPQYTTPGVHPDSATGLPHAFAGVDYSTVMTLKVPADTTINGYTVPIDSIGIVSFSGFPAGFSYAANSASGYWAGGHAGCVLITGNNDTIGTWPLIVHVQGYASGMSVPFTIDYYKIVIDSTHLGIQENENKGFEVYQNSPNPFANATEITFSSDVNSIYNVEVFNMIGKVIYKDAVKAQRGVNKFNFSASNLPEGVYFYKISNGNHTTTKRMIVASK